MSTLEANNIKKGAKTVDTDYVLDGCAKATLSLNMQTVSNIHSFNVSSIVDAGAGQFTINLTNSFNSTSEMAPQISSRRTSTWSNTGDEVILSAVNQVTARHVENGAYHDSSQVTTSILGALA